MEATYNVDGKIRAVYDETQHRHEGLLTIPLTQEQANAIGSVLQVGGVYVNAYRVNPTTKELYAVPICEKKYQKTVNNVILEMSVEEKAQVDAFLAAEEVAGQAEAARIAAKAAAIVDNLPTWQAISDAIDAATTLAAMKVIVKKMARVLYWIAKDKEA